MPKQPISVTLEVDNITWLKGRAGAAGARSVSHLLDELVTSARTSGRMAAPRSVVGTIDIDVQDSMLGGADRVVQAAFDPPLIRPLLPEASPARSGVRPPSARRRG